ncbi:putative PIN domain containing protein [Lyophyllum shimeji]|uniref:PIN domain containing protein n=1 Tax=Lyophyllum shimeji TaxID=47721 RepID=A0A9P3PWU9_LYOSH|nr:putative PIN domain containing protein [Lyophyllum shimeji]
MAEKKQTPPVSPNKLAMSRALGAAFLNHQVEQLEKTVSNGAASGNWRRRAPATQAPLAVNGNAKRPPMAPGIKVASRRPGEESQAARKARTPGRDTGGGMVKTTSQGAGGRRKSSDEEKERERDEKDADVVVVDASVLVHALYQLKKWCRDGREEVVIVPLEALNTLDLLKKGTSPLAQRARAASRVLEAQVGTNPRIRVQQDDAFVLWDSIEFNDVTTSSDSTKSSSAPAPPTHTSPEWVRRTICCAQWEVEHGAEEAAKGTKNPPPSGTTTKVVLAVLAPTPAQDLASSLGDLKLSSSPTPSIAPVPLPSPHLHANKHEPRSSGTLVAHWAARARIEMLTIDPTAAPAEDEAGGRTKRTSRPRRPSDGSAAGGKGHHSHAHGGGALVERPPAVMAMMEMVAQPSKVVRVLARGENSSEATATIYRTQSRASGSSPLLRPREISLHCKTEVFYQVTQQSSVLMARGRPEHLLTPCETLHPLEPEARRSDYIVPEAAQKEFREMRGVIEDEVDRLDAELVHLEGLMEGLRRKRAACMERIAEINAAIAPHKKLPPELLSAIFLRVHKQQYPLELPPSQDALTKDGPWCLSRVCSRWRQVVWGISQYWHAVRLSGFWHRNSLGKVGTSERLFQSVEMTKDILHRGTRVLTIQITSCDALPAGINPLADLLGPFATQLHEVTVGCCADVLEPFLDSPPPFFQALESLDLTLWTSDIYSPHQLLPQGTVFSNAPNLRKVRINTGLMCGSHIKPPLQLHKLRITWGQLTNVSLVGRRMNFTDCSHVLQLCHNLVQCYLHSEAQYPGNATHPFFQSPIVLPHLRVLELHVYEEDNAASYVAPSQFFSSLVLPSLSCLTLGLQLPARIIRRIGLGDVIARSGCKLERFRTTSPIPPSFLDQFLETVSPMLQKLDITESEISIPSLERIARGVLLPKLTSLGCCIPSLDGLEAFAQVIKNREEIQTAYAESPRTLPEFWNIVQERCKTLNEQYRPQGRSITAGVARYPVFAW